MVQLYSALLNDYLSEVRGGLVCLFAAAGRGSVERGSSCVVDLHVPSCRPAIRVMHLSLHPESSPLPPLLQVTYPAELAGLHYGVRSTVAGLLVTVYGYSDTLATLAQVRTPVPAWWALLFALLSGSFLLLGCC